MEDLADDELGLVDLLAELVDELAPLEGDGALFDEVEAPAAVLEPLFDELALDVLEPLVIPPVGPTVPLVELDVADEVELAELVLLGKTVGEVTDGLVLRPSQG